MTFKLKIDQNKLCVGNRKTENKTKKIFQIPLISLPSSFAQPEIKLGINKSENKIILIKNIFQLKFEKILFIYILYRIFKFPKTMRYELFTMRSYI